MLTEIAYRQPISLALVKKMVTGIGPIKVTEICQKLEKPVILLGGKEDFETAEIIKANVINYAPLVRHQLSIL